MEGERYKKSPEIVRQLMENGPDFEAPHKYIVFKSIPLYTAKIRISKASGSIFYQVIPEI